MGIKCDLSNELGGVEVEGRYGTECCAYVVFRAAKCAEMYALLIDPIRKVARQFGYAVAQHGTLARDIDLVAIPWTESAVAAETLVEAVRCLVAAFNKGCGTINPPEPALKPHGRRAWSIHGLGGFYIDFSVMPLAGSPDGDSVS